MVGVGATNLADFIPDESVDVPDEAASKQLLREHVRNVLGFLSERERRVLEMRYGLNGREPSILEDVGRHLGITRDKVRQIEHYALRRMATETPELQAFLR